MKVMFRDYGDLSLKFALRAYLMIFRRSAAKFRSLALDEAPMEVIKILPRISVGGISMVSSSLSSSCSGRWLVGPFRTSNKLNKLFYLTRPQLALLKSLLYNDR